MRVFMCICLILFVVRSHASVVEQIGSLGSWTTEWNVIHGLDDEADASLDGTVDFVGDASDPGLYWDSTEDYVFLRFRVNWDGDVVQSVDGKGTFQDTLCVLVDVGGAGAFDYGFTWDANSNPTAGHGLEMSILGTDANSWGGVKPTDFDGVNGKNELDINGDLGGRGYDGYIRTVDHQSTANFGDTTFIDYAISWDYLNQQTTNGLLLADTPIEEWNITLASIENAQDHNFLSTDIGGGASPDSLVSEGWIAVPEPAVASLISLAGIFLLIGRRIFF